MRLAARVDANHAEIVEALRKAGAKVQSLAAIGKGCPDLLVGYNKKNYLIEVKSGANWRFTPDEKRWQIDWSGQVNTVVTPEEAISVIKGKGNK